jgi:hypothetical protein
MQPKILSIEEEILEEYRPPLARKRKGRDNKNSNLIDFSGKKTRSATKKHTVLFGVEQSDIKRRPNVDKNGGARERPSVILAV